MENLSKSPKRVLSKGDWIISRSRTSYESSRVKKRYQYQPTSFRRKELLHYLRQVTKWACQKCHFLEKFICDVSKMQFNFSLLEILWVRHIKSLSTQISSILTRFSIKWHFPSIMTTYVKTIEKPNTIIDVSDNMVAEAMSLKDLATLTNAWTPRSLLFESRKTLIKWFSNSNVLCSTWKKKEIHFSIILLKRT